VHDLEEWIITTRSELSASDKDYLFRVKDKSLISTEQVSIVMKKTVEFCGFDSAKISAHSLRYGGATMLAAAGLPQYIIAYFGGWCEDSKSLQIYTQLNVSSNRDVSRIFSQGDKASLEETRIRHSK
jgi:site-specific recombinase XerD